MNCTESFRKDGLPDDAPEDAVAVCGRCEDWIYRGEQTTTDPTLGLCHVSCPDDADPLQYTPNP